MSHTSTWTVTGMTCQHCVASVTEEIAELAEVAGASDVAVDLATGTLTVTSATPLDPATVEAAVAEAGYALVP